MSQTTVKRELDRIQGDTLEHYIFSGGSPSASPFPLSAEGLWDEVEVKCGIDVDRGHAPAGELPLVIYRGLSTPEHPIASRPTSAMGFVDEIRTQFCLFHCRYELRSLVGPLSLSPFVSSRFVPELFAPQHVFCVWYFMYGPSYLAWSEIFFTPFVMLRMAASLAPSASMKN